MMLWRAAFTGVLLLSALAGAAAAAPDDRLGPKVRCPVCGMLVGKHAQWLAQMVLADGKILAFDGPKDLFAYYFHPDRYGSGSEKVEEIWIKDYYDVRWHRAEQAFFVIGSDVLGPMGHELIPFSSRQAADNFSADHHGRQVASFAEITPALVETLRAGQQMR